MNENLFLCINYEFFLNDGCLFIFNVERKRIYQNIYGTQIVFTVFRQPHVF